MDLFLALTQGLGLATASGLRSFLAPLLVGALASASTGVDFDGTDFAFVADAPFLAVVFALTVASFALDRRRWPPPSSPGPPELAFGIAHAALGAVLFGASMAERGEPVGIGLVAGALVALAAWALAGDVIAGAASRAGEGSDSALPAFAAVAALLVAGITVAWPPLALPAVAALVWLGLARRRRAGRKYEGLRVLRD